MNRGALNQLVDVFQKINFTTKTIIRFSCSHAQRFCSRSQSHAQSMVGARRQNQRARLFARRTANKCKEQSSERNVTWP